MDKETLREKLKQLIAWLVENGFTINNIYFEISRRSYPVQGDAIPVSEAPRWGNLCNV